MRGFAPTRRGSEECGVSPPHDEVLLFRQKDPKPLAPGRGCAPVPVTRAAELASLRQSSPPHRNSGTGAQPRPQAPGNGAIRWRFPLVLVCHARPRSGIQCLWFFLFFVKTRDDTLRLRSLRQAQDRQGRLRSPPTESWCLRVGAGLCARPVLTKRKDSGFPIRSGMTEKKPCPSRLPL